MVPSSRRTLRASPLPRLRSSTAGSTSMPSTSMRAPRRQRRHLVGRARRVRRLEVGRHDLVDLGEVGEVDQQHRQLDDVVELAARRLRDRAQIREHLVRLRLDAVDELPVAGSSPIWPDR